MFANKVAYCVFAAACLMAGIQSLAAGDADKQLEAIKEHLKAKHPGKKWQIGPKQLTSDEIKAAYGDKISLYFVHSSPPLPPGAPLPDLLKAYQDKVKDWQTNYISVVLRIDADGKIHNVAGVPSYRVGLMPVKNDADAKTAAAAVLSLVGGGSVSPGVVQAKEVTLVKVDQGWKCEVERKNNFHGTVEFDKEGQLTKVSKVSIAPLPP